MPLSNLILVAIPDEWSPQVCQYLEQLGLSILTARSQDEALATIQQQKDLHGIIIVSDWAMSTQIDGTDGIIKLVQGKMPTVTIITKTSRQQSGYRYMDEVFFPPYHEYLSGPFDLEALKACMRKIGML